MVPSSEGSERSLGTHDAHTPVLQLQRAAGNQAVGLLLQAKLEVSEPGDPLEQEADRIADRVMSSVVTPIGAARHAPGALLQRKCDGCGGAAPCPKCDDEEPTALQRKAEPSSASPPPAGSPIGDLGPGEPLHPSARAFLEPRFGHAFGGVRIHAGAAASASARSFGAHAYTLGNHIVFGSGRYAPETHDGRRLLAHELAHVLQQRGASRSDRAARTIMRDIDLAYCRRIAPDPPPRVEVRESPGSVVHVRRVTIPYDARLPRFRENVVCAMRHVFFSPSEATEAEVARTERLIEHAIGLADRHAAASALASGASITLIAEVHYRRTGGGLRADHVEFPPPAAPPPPPPQPEPPAHRDEPPPAVEREGVVETPVLPFPVPIGRIPGGCDAYHRVEMEAYLAWQRRYVGPSHWRDVMDAWFYETGPSPVTFTGLADPRNADIVRNVGFQNLLARWLAGERATLPDGSWIQDRGFQWRYELPTSRAPGGHAAFDAATHFLGTYVADLTLSGDVIHVSVSNRSNWESGVRLPDAVVAQTGVRALLRDHPRGGGHCRPPSRGGNLDQFYVFDLPVPAGLSAPTQRPP